MSGVGCTGSYISFPLLLIVYVAFISKEWQKCEHGVKNFLLFYSCTQYAGHGAFEGFPPSGGINFIKFKEIRHKLFILTYYINLIDPRGICRI